MNGQDMAQRWADESVTCERGHRYLPSEWGCPDCEMEDEREMTAMRHTPAPWTVVRLPSQFAGYAIKEAHERIKAARENGQRWNEEAEGNRMLIEATPDLLEAAIELVGLIERMPNASAILAPNTAGARVMAQAGAAIAKATGQESAIREGDPAPGGANCMFHCPEWCDECAHQENLNQTTPDSTDATQGALFDLPPAKAPNAISEGR